MKNLFGNYNYGFILIWGCLMLTGYLIKATNSATTESQHVSVNNVNQTTEVLLFTKTAGFRHDIIEYGSEVIQQLGQQGDFEVTWTEDSSVFTDEELSGYAAIIFFNTSDDVLDEEQKVAFQNYIRGGGGFVGIHQGITTHQNWDWFLDMVGGGMRFDSHPGVKEGVVIRLEDADHPSTAHMPEEWVITEEIHNYTVNPRHVTNVLLNVDESSYEGGNMGDHPISWYHTYEGGRIFSTGLGHTEEIFDDEVFHQHLIGAIRWSAGWEGPTAAELAPTKDKWWNELHNLRIPITVGAAGQKRIDVPAEIDLDFANVLQDHSDRLDENSLRLVEVNSKGDILDNSVPFQFDQENTTLPLAESQGALIFKVTGMTPAHSARHYHLYLGTDSDGNTGFEPPSFIPQVVVTDNIFHRDKVAYKITTRDARGVPNTTYYYHKPGGGFASMYDADGYDWLDYSPAEGDLGEWRGIPQLGWQGWEWERADEDPGFGHPDYDTGQSEIVHHGPLKTTIRAWSDNGDYEMYYEVYPAFVRLNVTRVPEREYWFLYEGPPGGEGELDETDLFVRDDGSYSPLSQDWAGELEWGYFTSKARNRSLYLIHEDFRNHDYREASYWQLRTMTVFGFGRGSGEERMTPLLDETPNRFIFGFTDGVDYEWVSKVVNSALNPLSYRIYPLQARE